MLSRSQSLRIGESELQVERFVPYVRHVDRRTVALDSGAVMRMWRLHGLPAEALDQGVINQVAIALNEALRSLAHERASLWTHLLRQRQPAMPADDRTATPFIDELFGSYEASLSGARLFRNRYLVSLVVTPGQSAAGKWRELVFGSNKLSAVAAADLMLLNDLSIRLEALLRGYGARPLEVVDRSGCLFSECAEALRAILTGRQVPVPLARADLGRSLMSFRTIWGHEAVEIREPGDRRFSGMLSVFDYPAKSRLGALDPLAQAPLELVVSQSFSFLSKAAAHKLLEKRRRQMASAQDRAVTQAELLLEAADEIENGTYCLGEHHLSVAVIEEDQRRLAPAIAEASRVLSEAGIVSAREDLSLVETWFGQLPGNRKHMAPRRAWAVSSANFVDLCPFHSFAEGRSSGLHWGAPVMQLRTSALSRYAFNYHVRDVGHALILGATGAGKSTLLNMSLAGLHRLGATVVLFDKDRGAEVFVGVNGGTYLQLKLGLPTGAAPLKAMDVYSDRFRAFLCLLVQRLVGEGRGLTASEKNRIELAIRAVERLPREMRSMSALRSNLGGVAADDVGQRLERWCRGHELGWVLDGEVDVLPFELGRDAAIIGLDLAEILRSDEAREPLMMYFFERLDRMVDGRKLVWAVEEFHAALSDPMIRRQVDDALRVWRRRNGMAILVSQNPGDAINSPIGETLIQQTPTKIFLPNPGARHEDYVGKLGCLEREFELTRKLAITSRRFLVCQHDPEAQAGDMGAALTGNLASSVLCTLDLGGFDRFLRALSPQSERGDFAAWDRARARGGPPATLWRRFCSEAAAAASPPTEEGT